MKRSDVVAEAGKITAVDRNQAYGNPEDNFQNIADIWNAQMSHKLKRKAKFTASDVALLMVGMKLARLKHNPSHEDSWVDIAGYAACGAECEHKEPESESAPGFLFVAPLCCADCTQRCTGLCKCHGWVEMGYTTEGFSYEPIEPFSVKREDLVNDRLDLGATIRAHVSETVDRAMRRAPSAKERQSEDLATIRRVAAKHAAKGWVSEFYRCSTDDAVNPHEAHTMGARDIGVRQGVTWCDGYV